MHILGNTQEMGLNSPTHTELTWISTSRPEWRGGWHHLYRCRLPLQPGEVPVTRTSTPGRARQEEVLFTQHISSQSTQAGGALRKPAKEKLQVCKKGNSSWAGDYPLPITSFQVVQDESTYTELNGGTWQGGPPPPGLRPTILAGDTFTCKDHHPPNAHHQERISRLDSFPRKAKRQINSMQGYLHVTPLWGHASSRASLALGRFHVVPDSGDSS